MTILYELIDEIVTLGRILPVVVVLCAVLTILIVTERKKRG